MSKLTEIAERIDETLREWDFSWNRTTGGVLDRRLRVERHTMGGLVLPTALVFILWCGPVAGGGPRFWLALLGSLIGVVVMVALMRETQQRQMPLAWDLVVQLALFALTIAAVARFGSERPGPEGQIYPHIIMLGAVAFGFCAIVSVVLARWAFQRREAFDTFAPILRRCELFVAPRKQVTITWSLACQAAAVVPFRNPEHLLFLPALAALLAPGTIWFGFRACAVVGLGVFVVNSGLVVLGQLDRRLGSMIALSQALLFRGTSLVVSGLIVALAMARLANIDYVSTLLDSVQTSDIVVSFAWAAYIVSWWYDYWVGRLTSEQLIRSLGLQVSPSSVAYPIDPTIALHAPADNRLIELHGASRFAVFRPTTSTDQRSAFQSYGTYQIFHRLADEGGEPCTPGIVQLSRNAWTYGLSVTILPFVVLAGMAFRLHDGVQHAELIAGSGHSTLPVQSMLFDPTACAASSPANVIALAASGGGTRAAVFTGALLEGLRARQLLSNVRLMSGVSGGGAALAYFASRRPELLGAGNEHWDAYLHTMTAAYIADVMSGLGEWRVVNGTRLGVLLDESFRDHWNIIDDSADPPRIYLEDVRDVGLLWNTSIAGHFLTRPIGENATDSIDLLERIHRDEWTHTVTGRLVLTNLAFSKPLDFLLPNVAGSDSQYVIVDDPKVRLTTAAALNANFPPVFSNAGVDLPEGHRYWVTDGGALDNSGLESLLYAMRQAIDKTDWTKCTPPTIHVITADAGAYSEKYSQDRGVSTALGAGTVFASRLSSELARDIAARYKGVIGFHYLEMPKTLRRSGSFGTHWMLQPNITVAPDNGSQEVTLSGEEVVALTRALFSGRTDQLSPKAVSVYDATKHNFDASWNELLKELGNPAR